MRRSVRFGATAMLVAGTAVWVGAGSARAEDILCTVGQGNTTTVPGSGVRFYAAGSGSGLQQFQGTIDFGDGESASVSGAEYSVTHSFDVPKTYSVQINGTGSMVVTYADGSSGVVPCTTSGVQSVVTVLELRAAFSTKVAADGQTVTFDASASKDAAIINGYRWQFSDGGTAVGRSTFRKFSPAGSYSVRLTVVSAYGSASASRTVALPGPPQDSEGGGINTAQFAIILGMAAAGIAATSLLVWAHQHGSAEQKKQLLEAASKRAAQERVEKSTLEALDRQRKETARLSDVAYRKAMEMYGTKQPPPKTAPVEVPVELIEEIAKKVVPVVGTGVELGQNVGKNMQHVGDMPDQIQDRIDARAAELVSQGVDAGVADAIARQEIQGAGGTLDNFAEAHRETRDAVGEAVVETAKDKVESKASKGVLKKILGR